MAEGKDSEVVVGPWPSAGGSGPRDPGMEERIIRLEAGVQQLQSDMSEVKAALARIEPRVSEMAGTFPHLATKAEISGMVAALPHLATKADLARRPTVTGIIAIVAMVAAVASMPVWPEWVAVIKAIASVGR